MPTINNVFRRNKIAPEPSRPALFVKPALPQNAQEIGEKLWDVLGKRRFKCDNIAKTLLAHGAKGEADKYADLAKSKPQNKIHPAEGDEEIELADPGFDEFPEPDTACKKTCQKLLFNAEEVASEALGKIGELRSEIGEFMVDVGLSAPVVHQIASLGKMGLHTVLAVLTHRKVQKSTELADYFNRRSEYAELGGRGVAEVFRGKFKQHRIKIGAYGFEAAVGFFDPTPATSLSVSTGLLAQKLRLLYETNKAIKNKVNPMLQDEGRFKREFLDVFAKFPLLSCYLFQEDIDTSTLLGVVPSFDLYRVPRSDQDAALAHIHQRIADFSVKQLQTEYNEHLFPLEGLALGRKAAAPYILYTKEDKIPPYLSGKRRAIAKLT